MRYIYLVKGAAPAGRLTGAGTINELVKRIHEAPSDVRRFPRQLTVAANDMNAQIDSRGVITDAHGEFARSCD
jgi:hypothetical protein